MAVFSTNLLQLHIAIKRDFSRNTVPLNKHKFQILTRNCFNKEKIYVGKKYLGNQDSTFFHEKIRKNFKFFGTVNPMLYSKWTPPPPSPLSVLYLVNNAIGLPC